MEASHECFILVRIRQRCTTSWHPQTNVFLSNTLAIKATAQAFSFQFFRPTTEQNGRVKLEATDLCHCTVIIATKLDTSYGG